jgi:hypothetical protein
VEREIAMTVQPGWAPPRIGTAKANIAHAHDCWPGGNHNFRADQDAARALVALDPDPQATVPRCQAGRPEDLRKYRAHVGVGVKPTFAPITRSEYGR